MSKLPPEYAWLETVSPPQTIVNALALFGTKEVVGKGTNPEIASWAKELGLEKVFSDDDIPWCGLFVGVVTNRSTWGVVNGPLWARNWQNFGVAVATAGLGDVLVFSRPGGGGHVGFYVGEDAGYYHVLGGNQMNAVTITRIAKSRCIAKRRPKWRVSQPESVKPYHLTAKGAVSSNEA